MSPAVLAVSFAAAGPAVDVFIPLLFVPWCPWYGLPSLLLLGSFLLLVFTEVSASPCCCWCPSSVANVSAVVCSMLLLAYLLSLIYLRLLVILLPFSCCSHKKHLRLSDYDYQTGNFFCYWTMNY